MTGRSSNGIKDGFYNLSYRDDGVYISVYPSEGDGRNLTPKEVLEKLIRKGIKGIDTMLLERVVKEASKTPIKIAEAQPEVLIDADVEMSISPDEMKAYATLIEADGGKSLTAAAIMAALQNQGIVHGIKYEVLKSLEEHPIYNEMICVAEGTPVYDGTDGYVKYNFDTKRNNRPTIMEDGTVNYRELNLVQSVRKGDVLCALIPPTPGRNGKTVTGREIGCREGKPAKLPRGRNVVVSEDETLLMAAIDGQIDVVDGKVNVFATYEVKADVDNSTGNIKFIGNVSIRGNVLSGFRVEAGGNVEVWGVVEGAEIYAGGDIVLRRGIQGMGKGVLSSEGDVVSRYIENSTVRAKGDIKSEAIMHSNIVCGQKLILSGRRGLLVGGSCRVGQEIEARLIGSSMSAFTNVEVGLDPRIRDEYKQIEEKMRVSQDAIHKAQQAIKILSKLEEAGTLTPEKKELLDKSTRTKSYHENLISEIKDRKRELEEMMRQEASGKIKCYDTIYPGTKVSIGTAAMFVREPLKYCILFKDGADIRTAPLR